MTLKETLEAEGRWLFAWRGVLPLMIPFLALPVLFHHAYPWGKHLAQEAWMLICIGISLTGQAVRFMTLGAVPSRTSGRNRRHQVADSLNTDGWYSVVRNPLYLGNCLTWVGIACVPGSVFLVAVVALVFWLFHERVILAEEAFLEQKFGDSFRQWAAVTPAFLPNFRRFRVADRPFSFRAALGKEYVNLFAVTSAFTALEFSVDSIAERRIHLDAPWAGIWLSALAAFAIVRFLRKRTRVLSVEGRE